MGTANRFIFLFLVIVSGTEADGQTGEFAGLKLGVGLSLTIDLGDNDRIEEAAIVDGIVRVSDENNSRARIMLESHYFFTGNKRFLGSSAGNWGIGPFIAVQPGSDEIIEAIGGGVMVGFRRAGDSNSSWNLGLGIVVDPDVRILGDGFTANQPPPGSETDIRFKEKSQAGLLIISSFSF